MNQNFEAGFEKTAIKIHKLINGSDFAEKIRKLRAARKAKMLVEGTKTTGGKLTKPMTRPIQTIKTPTLKPEKID